MDNLNREKISVFGLGYVGCVGIACLAESGFYVVGVDIKESKVKLVNEGAPTIYEPGLDELMRIGHMRGRISATSVVEDAIKDSSISLITVGTPRLPNGGLNLSYIYDVAKQIGTALKSTDRFHVIAIRSTVKPGTHKEVSKIISKYSGKIEDKHFGVVVNPEFLREGTAIEDYRTPPYVLIGAENDRCAEILASLYANIESGVIYSRPSTAEIIKYINNSWHALKVAFANEVGSVCKAQNLDSNEVIDIFLKDNILNISPSYLRPGFAYGGSCLPKDLSGLVSIAKEYGVGVPVLENIASSNFIHIGRAVELVKSMKCKKVSIFGLTFKDGTDDLRNSPSVELVKKLIKEDYEIKIYDKDVLEALKDESRLAGVKELLGDLTEYIVEKTEVLYCHSKITILAKKGIISQKYLADYSGLHIIDLVCINYVSDKKNTYEGLAW